MVNAMCIRGSIMVLIAAASCGTSQLSAQEIASTRCVEQCGYLSKFAPDVSIEVIPSVRRAAIENAFEGGAISVKANELLVAE